MLFLNNCEQISNQFQWYFSIHNLSFMTIKEHDPAGITNLCIVFIEEECLNMLKNNGSRAGSSCTVLFMTIPWQHQMPIPRIPEDYWKVGELYHTRASHKRRTRGSSVTWPPSWSPDAERPTWALCIRWPTWQNGLLPWHQAPLPWLPRPEW